MNCRHCQNKLEYLFLDLGSAPPSNAYRLKEDLQKLEMMYPLRIFVCDKCWLVQTEDFVDADELFSPEYAYFSSTSISWLAHSKQYYKMICRQLSLNGNSFVIEIASNDGYLLKNFVKAGIPCLGIEPTKSTADVAEKLGVPILREFFGNEIGKRLANEKKQADLIIANNVCAHVPDINNFMKGIKAALKPRGTITLEFSSLIRLIDDSLFDICYHEHYSYFSLHTIKKVLENTEFRIFNIENFPIQGGSLRVYGCHLDDPRPATQTVKDQLEKEKQFGLLDLKTYRDFQIRVDKITDSFLTFLIEKKCNGKLVAAYGAAAKGNTLLNYAGVKPELLPFVCDAASSKQGNYLPGSHIPIFPPDYIKEQKPDYILILPWNIAGEIKDQLSFIQDWGGKFVTAIPDLTIS